MSRRRNVVSSKEEAEEDDENEEKESNPSKNQALTLSTFWPVFSDWVFKPFFTGLVAGVAFHVAGTLLNQFWAYWDRRNPASAGAITTKSLRDLKEIERLLQEAITSIKTTAPPATPPPAAAAASASNSSTASAADTLPPSSDASSSFSLGASTGPNAFAPVVVPVSGSSSNP